MEQLDAHVQSYRNEQKRKEQDRIRGIFQYLEKKRKQLLLSKHPVKSLHFNINNLTPPKCSEFLIKKITVDSKVKFKKEPGIQPNEFSNLMFLSPHAPIPQTVNSFISEFSIDKYNFEPSEVVLDAIQNVDIPNKAVSYEFKGTSISLSAFHDVTAHRNPELNFEPPIQLPLNLKKQPQITGQHDFKSRFVVPDITLPVLPLQATRINMEQVDYKIEDINVRRGPHSIPSPTSLQFQIDFQKQLIKNDIRLNSVVAEIPIFESTEKTPEIPHCAQTFVQPRFDFSDVLEKLRKVLTDAQN